ncbi:hypothetical protein ESY86_20155 [Subsaximicrobium wynnwilliamsii]|uniref:Uncharacterized protein n=1 Tax=Subsaximicrobium wynnwilliamsii TaxID=291179 RepID=A0A5C6ZB53_9FLAO|nr:hypothetical protein ESY87_19490 [Subsaximicrobium wynnwilliamsii]TXD86462.1 hypothetical protein ESY86_20155 [Subsaximicrobium wynnwilliamsii]TXE00067.1 hypothetical protein ESY88_20130 [Subsaximicrobium wynnwilliamsii]
MYKQWLVLAYLEIPAEFPMASTCLQLSVTNHATAHTLNVVKNGGIHSELDNRNSKNYSFHGRGIFISDF